MYADVPIEARKTLPAFSTASFVQGSRIIAALTFLAFGSTTAVGSKPPIIEPAPPPSPTPTPRLADLLIGQWQQSPRLVGVVDLLQTILDAAVAAKDRFDLMRDIDAAEGVWLDYLGLLVGVSNAPACLIPRLTNALALTPLASRSTQRRFGDAAVNDAIYPLPDPIFRRMVKARAITVFSDGTIFSLSKAIKDGGRHCQRG